MDPLSREALEERFALLVNGQFAELGNLTRGQDDQQDRQLHQRLAEADMAEVDLLEVFERWVPEDQVGACHILLPSLGLSSLADAPRLERLLKLVPDSQDALAHHVGEALQTRFASQPSLASDLVACIVSEAPVTDRACQTWAISFAMAQPVLAALFVVARLGPPVRDLRATSALVVTLPWRFDAVREVIASHHQALLNYLVSLSDTDAENAWYCIVEIAQFDRAAFRLVAEALSAGIADVASQVARSFFRIEGVDYGAEGVPLVEVLRRLVELALQNKSICHNVDLALSSCLRKPAQRACAVDSLLALGNGPDDVLARFNLTFQSSVDDEALFRTLLTNWLLSPTASFAVIRDMLNLIAARPARAELGEELFAAAPSELRTKAIRRLLGIHTEGPMLCRFAASVARMTSLSEEGLGLAANMFNFLKNEFPGATEEFLAPLCKPACRRERGAEIFRGIYASSVRWKRHLERLPNRLELRISDADAFSLRSARAKLNDIVRRGGVQNSFWLPFLQRCT